MSSAPRPYERTEAVLATKHGKEQVIAPLLERALGLRVAATTNVDTDRFGTFSRDVERTGSQIDAARAKIAAAFAAAPDVHVALASEGSFGPHPYIPFLPLAREIVVLSDRASGLELIGHHASPTTNFSHAVVSDVAAAFAFADRAQFPGHGLIVLGCSDGQPAPARALIKDIRSPADFTNAVERVIGICRDRHAGAPQPDPHARHQARDPGPGPAVPKPLSGLLGAGFCGHRAPRRTTLFMVRRADVGDQG
jgi:hypothetical protein